MSSERLVFKETSKKKSSKAVRNRRKRDDQADPDDAQRPQKRPKSGLPAHTDESASDSENAADDESKPEANAVTLYKEPGSPAAAKAHVESTEGKKRKKEKNRLSSQMNNAKNSLDNAAQRVADKGYEVLVILRKLGTATLEPKHFSDTRQPSAPKPMLEWYKQPAAQNQRNKVVRASYLGDFRQNTAGALAVSSGSACICRN
jgi:hypothetical protein